MTISSTTNKISYAGNGSTLPFSFPYYFVNKSDLLVYIVQVSGTIVTKVLGTDYTIPATAPYPSGTNVLMNVAPAVGEKLVMTRVVPYTQTLDLVENDPLPAEDVEKRFDLTTMMIQQLAETLARAPTLDVTSAQTGITMADFVAGKSLIVDGTGLRIIMGPTADQISAAQGYAIAAAASAAAAATYDPTALIHKDGSVAFTANQPLGGFNFTGAGAAASRSSFPTVAQQQDQTTLKATITGTANAILAALSPALPAYSVGSAFYFIATATNTTASPTVNVNGLGVKTLYRNSAAGTTALGIGDIINGSLYHATYNGTGFVVDAVSPRYIGTQKFETAGTFTYTMSAGTRFIEVDVVGGGGSGSRSSSGVLNCGGSGAGYAHSFLTDSSTFNGVTVTVGGAGGAQTVDGTGGNNGATSSFGALLSATAGRGGILAVDGTSLPGAGSGGDINRTGGYGWAVTSGAGSSICVSTGGACAYLGAGAVAAGASIAGANGVNFGDGGTGSSGGNNSGAGRAGAVYVREYA